MNDFVQNKWAVVVSGYARAKNFMHIIEAASGKEVLYKRQSICFGLYTEFADGTILRWIRPVRSSRGYKFGKMWCDRNIDQEILQTVILPCYWGDRSEIVWL